MNKTVRWLYKKDMRSSVPALDPDPTVVVDFADLEDLERIYRQITTPGS